MKQQSTKRSYELSVEKRALLEALLRERGWQATPVERIPRRSGDRPVPASCAQRRLWFVDQLLRASPAYNIPVQARLDGNLDMAALERAVNETARRHEILRTTFAVIEGNVVQVIAPATEQRITLIDLSDQPIEDREAYAQTVAKQEAQAPFDLEHGPLLRVTLVRLAINRHELFVTMHHSISEAWSFAIYFRELSKLYNAFYAGTDPSLPDPALQYGDYSTWEQQRLQGEEMASHLAYWKDRLAGSLPILQLPTDWPRPAIQNHAGAATQWMLPKQLSDAILALANTTRTTLSMVMLAAFKALLFRYTDLEDVLVGTPVSNRNRFEIEDVIGYFNNTVVLRTDLAGNPSFLDLLSRVRTVMLEGLAHQDLPFEYLVEALQPGRDLSHSPIFQVMFVMQSAPTQASWRDALTLSRVAASCTTVGSDTAKFDLTLAVEAFPSGISLKLTYCTALFAAATIARMRGYLQSLVEGIVANPDCGIGQLPMLSVAETNYLLRDLNNTQRDFPTDQCLHELFEAQVLRTPDAIALIYEDRRITYRALNSLANQGACELRSRGAGPDTLIAICIERSAEMIIGLLAILKAGAAYVPLDPVFPAKRLGYMVDDSKALLVVTHQHLLRDLPVPASQIVLIDELTKPANYEAPSASQNPCSAVTPANLAYVIYTSGSTGRPKGVAIEHRQIVNYVYAVIERVGLRGVQHYASVSTLAADLGNTMVFPALCSGGCLHVIATERASDPGALAEYFTHHGIDALKIVPSHLAALLNEPRAIAALPRRRLVLGGESSSADLVANLKQLAPECEIYNHYGPTETTVGVLCGRIDEGMLSSVSGTAPLGRPLANCQVYVLDRWRQPVPLGVAGELYIGGAGVGRGYLNQPDLTGEKFMVHPFNPDTGARLYRTGDMARYLPDGNVEFLGRVDDQVKIRGFRIELGEVESTVKQHPNIRECLAVAWEEPAVEKRLIAYVVARSKPAPAASDLRLFVSEKLPAYMVPAMFVILDVLPLTPNGKVDRAALPAPGWSRNEAADAYVAPRNALEAKLAEIWIDELKVPLIGVRDNFFELGGHSLLAVRLLDRIEKQFGKRIHLNALWFEGATIEYFARVLEAFANSPSQSSSVVTMKSGSPTIPALFCVHTIGAGNLFHYDSILRYLDLQQPVCGLRARGNDTGEVADETVEEMARHCIEAMRTVQPTGPYLLCGYSSAGVIAFEMAQQLLENGEEVALLAMLDTVSATRRRTFLYYWMMVKELVRGRNLRGLQERLYRWVLMAIGMPHLRELRTMGEHHRWAMWNYRAKSYAGRISLIEASTTARYYGDPMRGWATVASGGIDFEVITGSHGQIVKEPRVQELVRCLQRRLNDAQARMSRSKPKVSNARV